jgi:hypothetical protein
VPRPVAANARARESLRARALLAAASAAACSAPADGDFRLAASLRGAPGAGAGLAFAQRLVERGERLLDLELGLERQELGASGPLGDDWTRLWTGLRSSSGARTEAGLVLGAGITWLRSEGPTGPLGDPGDYGGLAVGADWLVPLAPAVSTGPGLTLLLLDAEGSRSGSGVALQLAWSWVAAF